METLNGKSLYGQLWKTIEDQNAARESWLWLKDGRIASNTEATLMAIQDGVMWIRNYQNAIGSQDVVDTCRLCGEPKDCETSCSGGITRCNLSRGVAKIEVASTFSAIFRCETTCKHGVSHEEVFLASCNTMQCNATPLRCKLQGKLPRVTWP